MEIRYGLVSDKLSVQLNKQNLKFDSETVENFEKALDGLFRLRMLGVLLDSQYDKILPKIHNKIMAHIIKNNKVKEIKR